MTLALAIASRTSGSSNRSGTAGGSPAGGPARVGRARGRGGRGAVRERARAPRARPKIVFSAVDDRPTRRRATRAQSRAADATATLPADRSRRDRAGPRGDHARRSATTGRSGAAAPHRTVAPAASPAAPGAAHPARRGLRRADPRAAGSSAGDPTTVSTVMNAARFYCGIARGGRLGMALGHTANACADWGDALAADARPDPTRRRRRALHHLGRRRRASATSGAPTTSTRAIPGSTSSSPTSGARPSDLLGSRGRPGGLAHEPVLVRRRRSTSACSYANAHYLPALIGPRPGDQGRPGGRRLPGRRVQRPARRRGRRPARRPPLLGSRRRLGRELARAHASPTRTSTTLAGRARPRPGRF